MEPLETLHNLQPMNIASLSNVLVYLPVCLLVFYVVPKRFRPAVLLGASLGFYALAEIKHFILVCIAVTVNYVLLECVVRLGRRFYRSLFLWLCVAFNLALIGSFGFTSQMPDAAFPLGIFVIGLSGIEAALEAYREENPQSRSLVRFSLYMLFFPRLYVGPLVNAGDFYKGCANMEFDTNRVVIGFGRFAEGLLKFAAIGRSLFLLYASIKSIPVEEASVLSSWILVLSFALSLYFTLSGLSDIACGVSNMFGLALPQNFYYPYQSRSVSDFFERFNMTVGSYLRRNVKTPLTLKRPGLAPDMLSTLFVGIIWGIWFGIRPNCILWGVYVAVFIIMEKYLYPNILKRLPTLFCRMYTFISVLFGFTVLVCDTIPEILECLIRMLGLRGVEFFTERILYVLSSNWVLLVFSIILASNLISLLVSFVRKGFPRASLAVFAVLDVCILVTFISLTLGGDML